MAANLKFTVDGRELQASPGTLLIEACRASGIEVPSFCYYPGLSLQAACRMCLVEVEKAPKLQTACTLPVAEGMVVRTATPQVADARRGMLELLLANHPLDCPVCDKGGECELQDMVFRYGAGESRFAEVKRHVDEQQWSPVVFFDAPRCILCYRCVRVCDEGLGEGALGVLNRGATSEITPNHGDHLDCQECGMCIDICPVGALTSGAYRYKARPWEIKYVSTICTHCGDGCKTTLSVRNNKILRGNNRDHSGINGEFLCIKGRYAYDFVEHKERLKRPLVRKSGILTEVTWEEAIRTVAAKWKQILDREVSPPRIAFGVIGSNHTSNETNYLLQRFARTVLKTNNIDHARTADFAGLMKAIATRDVGRSDAIASVQFARSADLKTAPSVLLLGSNPTEQHPLIAWNIREGIRLSRTKLYVANSRSIPLAREAAALMPIPDSGEELAVRYLAGDDSAAASLIGTTPGGREVTSASLKDFRDRMYAESDLIVVFGGLLAGDAIDGLVEFGRKRGGPTRYIALGESSNSRGAADMGILPHLLPGYCSVGDPAARARFEAAWASEISSEPGLPLANILKTAADGNLESLYVLGSNPIAKDPSLALGGKTFLVVQDLFLHETAQAADLVLPAASAYESNGTFTNTCGELQRINKAIDVPGARNDMEIIAEIARQIRATSLPSRMEDVFREIVRVVPGYGISASAVLSGAAVPAWSRGDDSFHQVSESSVAIQPSTDDLFSSGTLGKFSAILDAERLRHSRPVPEPL
ncbi:MAG TPA: NADH-quinone oxidoreductase subunit NuoG [Candidatus Saccharimonadales bacterium]|nr:NADH-quinone oxidoreductase subunit NuoG [Candidatus Saccharimonadales bacterium]